MELNFKKKIYVNIRSDDIIFTDSQLNYFLDNQMEVVVYHTEKKESMWLCPIDLAMMKPIKKNDQILGWSTVFKNENIEIDTFNKSLLEKFHWIWIDKLDLDSSWFRELNKSIATLKKKEKVYPEQGTFRVFKQSPSKVRLVILGESPYPNSTSNGLAFSTDKSDTPYSLKKIKEVIERDFNKTISNDLLQWEDNGVFLLNSFLTVSKEKEIHKELWKPFITRVIKVLNEYRPVWILMGASAKSFQYKITGIKFDCEHPAASAYNDNIWNDNNVFIDAQKELKLRGFNLEF